MSPDIRAIFPPFFYLHLKWPSGLDHAGDLPEVEVPTVPAPAHALVDVVPLEGDEVDDHDCPSFSGYSFLDVRSLWAMTSRSFRLLGQLARLSWYQSLP